MLSKIHDAFPITKKCTYLNTPSSGLTSKNLIDFRKQYDNGIHTDYKKIDFLEDEQIDSLRTKIQKYFKAETAEIALLPSFSIGLNGIVDALPKHAKVLLLKGDYPSVNLPFEFRDFQIEYAEINENLEHNIDQKLERFQPDFIALSVVQFLNGIKIDLSFLQQVKKTYPHIQIIGDATQYLGTEKFNFDESAFSVIGSSGYKWFNAGTGNAFFIIDKDFLAALNPKSYGSNSLLNKPDGSFRKTGFLEPGHFDMHSLKSLEVALDFHYNEIGIESIEAQIKSLSLKAFNAFSKRNLLSNAVQKRKIHSCIFNLNRSEADLKKLLDANIVCAYRKNGIRVGFHYFNNEADLTNLLATLDEI